MTVKTIILLINNQTLKQNPVYHSLIYVHAPACSASDSERRGAWMFCVAYSIYSIGGCYTCYIVYYTTVGGWGSPAGCFPPCGVSPRDVWGLLPLRFLCRAS